MPIRRSRDGTIKADTADEMQDYLRSKPEKDLRSVESEGRHEDQPGGRGFITPLFCFLPTKSRNWILTPLACFYRPTSKR